MGKFADVSQGAFRLPNNKGEDIAMKVTPQQTEKLLKGNQTFSQLGLSMMLTRLKTLYAKDPSQTTIQICVDEINAFLVKFSMIMGQDYEIIAKL